MQYFVCFIVKQTYFTITLKLGEIRAKLGRKICQNPLWWRVLETKKITSFSWPSLIVGLVAMTKIPTNQYNQEIRMKLIEFVSILGGGVITIVAARLNRGNDSEK